MKNKIKKSIQLLGILLFLTAISCENDSITESESHDHSHGKAPNEVSFDFFIRTTTIKDVNSFLKEKISANRLQQLISHQLKKRIKFQEEYRDDCVQLKYIC